MKFTALILISLLMVSCSHFDSQLPKVRKPASQDPNCFEGVSYLMTKRRRGDAIKKLINNGQIKQLKDEFWANHRQEQLPKKIKYSSFYRKLRRLNQSFHVPHLFQKKSTFTGDIDTFSTIIKAVNDSSTFDAGEREAIEDIMGWIEHVQGYQTRMNQILERGFEFRRELQILEPLLKGPDALKKADFPRQVEVPVVKTDGDVENSPINFETIDDLKDYVKDRQREATLTFSQGYTDELFKKSRIYDVMLDQAIFYRRLQLVGERFNNIPQAKLHGDQIALKEMIDEVLTDLRFQPRADAVKKVRRKETWSEFWGSMKFWKSARVEKEAKYAIPSAVLEQAKALSPHGMMLRGAAMFTIISGAIITPITILYDDNAWVQYFTSMITNRFNDFLVFTLGLPSPSLSACYKAERTWNTEEQSTMNAFVESHLSRFTAESRIDPTINLEDNKDYVRRRNELQALCSKKRLEYRVADRHVKNKETLNEHGYRFAAHLMFIELVYDNHEKGEELAPVLHEYLEEVEIFEDEKKGKALLGEIESIAGKKFTKRFEKYRSDIKKAVPRIRKGDFAIYYPSLDDYLDAIDELPEK